MAPEQAQALPDVDGRTDLFSLGAILYEALTRGAPTPRPRVRVRLIDICTKDAPPLRERAPDVPEALARVVHRALDATIAAGATRARGAPRGAAGGGPGAAPPGARSQPAAPPRGDSGQARSRPRR
jgi:serine/threonine-protein kinase